MVSTFQEELGLPSVLFGVGLPDENAHAPNEKLDVANFHGGIIASAILYEEIAERADRRRTEDTEDTEDTEEGRGDCSLVSLVSSVLIASRPGLEPDHQSHPEDPRAEVLRQRVERRRGDVVDRAPAPCWR